MTEEQGTTGTVDTAPRRGRPPLNREQPQPQPKLSVDELTSKVKEQMLKESEREKALLLQISELQEALKPFAKLPAEPNEPSEKILFHLARGLEQADIKNGDVIRARKLV